MDEQFYVRIRGRVQGPYDTAKLQSLVRRGQLSRMHEVSTDRSLWRNAADFPELFASPKMSQVAASTTKQNGTYTDSTVEVENPAASSGEWYYALNQEQKGPISFEQLKGLLVAGIVSPTSLIWREGMPEWAPAESVPGLRTVAGFSSSTRSVESEASQSIGSDSFRTLKETTPWVGFLVICVMTTCILMAGLGVLAVLVGVRERQSSTTAGGLFLLLYAAVGIWGGMLLNGYNSNVRKYISSRSHQDLEAGFINLKTFWTYISIIIIIALVNFGALAIWAFSAGVSLG